MTTPVEVRERVEESVRRSLFGPARSELAEGTRWDGGPINPDLRPFHQRENGEELLLWASPLERYCVGVLHGREKSASDQEERAASFDNQHVEGVSQSSDLSIPDEIGQKPAFLTGEKQPSNGGRSGSESAPSDDFDLSGANRSKPTSMGMTFRTRDEGIQTLQVCLRGGIYRSVEIPSETDGKKITSWARTAIELKSDLVVRDGTTHVDLPLRSEGEAALPPAALKLRARAFVRLIQDDSGNSHRYITVVFENTNTGSGSESALFQAEFRVTDSEGVYIEPYDSSIVKGSADDPEVASLRLLYRDKETYAVGHGCAVDWEVAPSSITLQSAVLPAYEVPSVSPDISILKDGLEHPLQVSMVGLSELTPAAEEAVGDLLVGYADWCKKLKDELLTLDAVHADAAQSHVDLCEEALERMQQGWRLVNSDPMIAEAFRLSNSAINMQQARSRISQRKIEFTGVGDGLKATVEPSDDLNLVEEWSGNWRPFQIAFILACIPDIVDSKSDYRSTVDIIFFPTGGGKTEAYLGLAAFSGFYRRLVDPEDSGTDSFMRYTLRLLTTQQFTRAASLLVSMDEIRYQRQHQLGKNPFSIGVWLGGDTTPNNRKGALKALRKLTQDAGADNPFIVTKCPWCGAQMGPVKHGRKVEVVGYSSPDRRTVTFQCPDIDCPFSDAARPLPVLVIDEDIYESPPTLLIGTVDKFAMLAFNPSASTIFGRRNSTADVSPPNLIIQDELHLISGPLGSMVGLYETAVDQLCTSVEGEVATRPKIICSTATIRRYSQQVANLYGRGPDQARLFPPMGLDESDSFFSQRARDLNGEPLPGRRYIGVFGSTVHSMQSLQVRVAAAVLMAVEALRAEGTPTELLDPYWTNLNFFNSLRELGNTVSLLESDVPDQVRSLANLQNVKPRYPKNKMELTSRRASSEIPKALDELSIRLPDARALDVCLASNIIEVGVDVDRLGLMTIVGQPKTVSQYIQVSGRVGRNPKNGPGIVFTLYGPGKPRDRSHYERFKTFHQALYAQVEPTSVTPFALPVLQRAMHGALLALIRQSSEESLGPFPFPAERFDEALNVLLSRAEMVDDALDVVADIERIGNARREEWESWGKTEWFADRYGQVDPSDALMRYAGGIGNDVADGPIWDVPSSMRNVDAECKLDISSPEDDEWKEFSWKR